jgi:hypothetical protein
MIYYRWITHKHEYLHMVEADSVDDAESKFNKNQSVCIDDKDTWTEKKIFTVGSD